jgi:hypothetical protein
LVLDVQDWISILQPDASFSGVLVREEYREAVRALIQWFSEGMSEIPTEIAVDEDTMQVDEAFPNPFVKLSRDSLPKKGGFVLLGHPGIGEQFLGQD